MAAAAAAAVAVVQIYIKSNHIISYIFIDRWIVLAQFNVNFIFIFGKNCAHFSHSDCWSKFTRIYGNPNQSIYFQSIDLISQQFCQANTYIRTLLHSTMLSNGWCNTISFGSFLSLFFLSIHYKFGNVIFFGIISAS